MLIRSPYKLKRPVKPDAIVAPDLKTVVYSLHQIEQLVAEIEQLKGSIIADHEERTQAQQDTHVEYLTRIDDALAEAARRIATIHKGDPGAPGTPGKDAAPPPTLEAIVAAVLPHLPAPEAGDDGEPGKDGEHADPQQVVDLILEKGLIKMEHIGGLEERVAEIRNHVAKQVPQWRGGGDTVAAGSGITVSSSGGVKTISASGSSGTKVRDEVPAGASGTAFTLAHTPIASTLQLFRGGARQSVNNGDYTIVGAAITLTVTLDPSVETLTADYEY